MSIWFKVEAGPPSTRSKALHLFAEMQRRCIFPASGAEQTIFCVALVGNAPGKFNSKLMPLKNRARAPKGWKLIF